jgi:hypothetical protein
VPYRASYVRGLGVVLVGMVGGSGAACMFWDVLPLDSEVCGVFLRVPMGGNTFGGRCILAMAPIQGRFDPPYSSLVSPSGALPREFTGGPELLRARVDFET